VSYHTLGCTYPGPYFPQLREDYFITTIVATYHGVGSLNWYYHDID